MARPALLPYFLSLSRPSAPHTKWVAASRSIHSLCTFARASTSSRSTAALKAAPPPPPPPLLLLLLVTLALLAAAAAAKGGEAAFVGLWARRRDTPPPPKLLLLLLEIGGSGAPGLVRTLPWLLYTLLLLLLRMPTDALLLRVPPA